MSVLAKNEILYRCRCCLDDVNLEHMWKEISNDGQIQTFGNMLLECFSLPWFVKNEDDQPDYICSSCVDRLQSALEFKREIIASEQVLQGFLIQGEVKIELDVKQNSMVNEPKPIDNVEIESKLQEAKNPIESPVASDVKTRKRKWPKKRKGADRLKVYKKYTQMELREAIASVNREEITFKEACSKYNIPRNTLKNHLSKVNNISEDQNDSNDDYNKDKTFKLIEEIKMLLKYTNAIPFKTKTAKYYCAYCSTNGPMFPDADELRIHTKLHEDERLLQVDHFMRPYWLNEILKLDVMNLTCLMCNTQLPEWNEMFHHFHSKHGIEFDEAYSKIVPYNLSEPIKCVLCHEELPNFHTLDGHMNAHYNNYICPTCGDCFVANSRLEKHLQVHHQGKFPCKQCGKVFTLDKYRAKHYQLVHNKSIIKCEFCSETFMKETIKNEHLLKHHKDSVKLYTCEYCGRVYTTKSSFLKHISKEKYKCTECNKHFISFRQLKLHKVEHIE